MDQTRFAYSHARTHPATISFNISLWPVITGNLQVMSDNSPAKIQKQNPKRIKEILIFERSSRIKSLTDPFSKLSETVQNIYLNNVIAASDHKKI